MLLLPPRAPSLAPHTAPHTSAPPHRSLQDTTGEDDHPFAVWTRGWTAEENRHGDILNRYLYLCGRVDMRAVETTIQRLIANGLSPGLENNPYLCFVYTSFQERATKISHGNTARLAKDHGDERLARICGLVAADEGRHEEAYKRIVDQIMIRYVVCATVLYIHYYS